MQLPICSNNRLARWSYVDTADKALKRSKIDIVAIEYQEQMQLIYIDKNDSMFIDALGSGDPWTISTKYLPPKLVKRISPICGGRKLFKIHHVEVHTVQFSCLTYSGAEAAMLWFLHFKERNLAALVLAAKRGYKSNTNSLASKIMKLSHEHKFELERISIDELLRTSTSISNFTNISSMNLDRYSDNRYPSISASFYQLLSDASTYASWIKLQIDPEFLHQFRTCLRKSLAIVKYFQSMFGAQEIESFESEVKFLLRVSSKARDLDVFKDFLFRFQVDEHENLDLTPLIKICDSRLLNYYSEITRELNSPRFEALLSEWKRLLLISRFPAFYGIASDKWSSSTVQNAVGRSMSVGIFPDESTRSALRDYLVPLVRGYHSTAVALIKNNASDAKLHSARKQLRDGKYIFETLRLISNGMNYAKFYKDISATAHSLGQIHDLQVQMRLLKDIQEDLITADPDIATIARHLESTRKDLKRQLKKRIKTINPPH